MASLHQIVADQISPGNRIISSFGASEGQAAADLLPWHTGKNITAVILVCDLKILTIGKYQFPAHLKFHMENRDRSHLRLVMVSIKEESSPSVTP